MPPPKDPEKYKEWIKSIKESNRKRWADPIEREKQIKLRIGKKHSVVTKKKISKSLVGHHHSEETKQKIRESNKGKHDYLKTMDRSYIKEVTRKMGKANKGRKHSKEFTEQCSIRMTGKNNHRYKNGESKFPYCDKFTPKRKRAVRLFFGGCCICCGKHTTENIFKSKRGISVETQLAVHHIDHDKEQGCNGKPFNLVPLCISCHAKEQAYEEEYRIYINKILRDGFAWGIWNEQEYIKKVMY